ncbi:PREDICTED: serine/threonine-protein kinase BLUS1-like [Tarenaya hassleriana]|uniref:serine/threonine-protein kinase BLUS1-like n=1 Tax=Tarenaya hassleriana TaxID=28532 RepID=UPI00053C37ED|nr:PREDICTED: serine/threonine-protein kinase BLUS1-like [Tarenaya hassleriana]
MVSRLFPKLKAVFGSRLRKMSSRGGSKHRAYSANPKDYKLMEEVGFGASAVVYRAIYLPTNEVVAVKCLDLDRCNSNLDDIRREAQTLSLIDHPNVIKSFCSFVVERNLWVVMPFMAQGSCLHLMKAAYPDGFEEFAICSILKETLKALDYLHKQGHIHRDVKAGNILLDDNGEVKLADFGVSACLFDNGDRQRARNTFVGTPCWMAPEVLQPGSGYNSKADIWSFGITALELAHGHAPFSKYPPMKVLLMTIQSAPPGLDYDRDKKFSKSFKEMVAMCLVKDQTKRPTAEKLLKHSCFKHAKPPELSLKGLFADLPPLWIRVKALQDKDAQQLALKRLASADQEAISQSEYQRGVSAWNFDVEDLKAQASLLDDDDDNIAEGKAEEEQLFREQFHNKVNGRGQDCGHQLLSKNMNRTEKASDIEVAVEPIREEKTEPKNNSIEQMASSSEPDGPEAKAKPVRCQSQSGPLTPGIVLSHSASEKGRAYERPESERQTTTSVRRAPSFSGPLMLPNRASANSLSAPIKSSGGFRDSLDEKSKNSLVQIKGRFSVTSENLDPAKIMPMRKSASVGDRILESKSLTSQSVKESNNIPVFHSFLMPQLQNLFQHTSVQQDLIMNLLNSLQPAEATDGSQNGKLPPLPRGSESNGVVEPMVSERERLLLMKISELQARLNDLTEELDAEKSKYSQLQERIKAAATGEEHTEAEERAKPER